MADTFANSYDSSQPNMVPYPLYLQAAGGDPAIVYSAQDFRELTNALWPTSGPLITSDFKVTQRGAGANFSVDIAAGRGAIVNADVPATTALVRSTGVVNLTTPSAPGSGTRSHRVVAELLDKQVSGSLYGWRFHLLEDTGSGQPAQPPASFTIASVNIAAGAVSVVNASIVNTFQVAGFAKYTAAVSATGANQSIATAATTAVQLINPRSVSPDVTASGTNNTTFTLNKGGPWNFFIGARIKPGTTGAHFLQLVRNDTGEIITAVFPGNISSGISYDFAASGADVFDAGVSVTLNVVTNAGVAGGVIDSGVVGTGLRTYLVFQRKAL